MVIPWPGTTGVPEVTWLLDLGRAGFVVEDMASRMGNRCGGEAVMRGKEETREVVIMKRRLVLSASSSWVISLSIHTLGGLRRVMVEEPGSKVRHGSLRERRT